MYLQQKDLGHQEQSIPSSHWLVSRWILFMMKSVTNFMMSKISNRRKKLLFWMIFHFLILKRILNKIFKDPLQIGMNQWRILIRILDWLNAKKLLFVTKKSKTAKKLQNTYPLGELKIEDETVFINRQKNDDFQFPKLF